MVPEHLRPTFPDGQATMPPLETEDGAIEIAETPQGRISLRLVEWGDPPIQSVMVVAETLARRLAEQILFLVDGTVIIARDVGRG